MLYLEPKRVNLVVVYHNMGLLKLASNKKVKTKTKVAVTKYTCHTLFHMYVIFFSSKAVPVDPVETETFCKKVSLPGSPLDKTKIYVHR